MATQVRLCRPAAAAAAPRRRQHGSLEIMKTTQLRLLGESGSGPCRCVSCTKEWINELKDDLGTSLNMSNVAVRSSDT